MAGILLPLFAMVGHDKGRKFMAGHPAHFIEHFGGALLISAMLVLVDSILSCRSPRTVTYIRWVLHECIIILLQLSLFVYYVSSV
jgi:hypothetical protein